MVANIRRRRSRRSPTGAASGMGGLLRPHRGRNRGRGRPKSSARRWLRDRVPRRGAPSARRRCPWDRRIRVRAHRFHRSQAVLSAWIGHGRDRGQLRPHRVHRGARASPMSMRSGCRQFCKACDHGLSRRRPLISVSDALQRPAPGVLGRLFAEHGFAAMTNSIRGGFTPGDISAKAEALRRRFGTTSGAVEQRPPYFAATASRPMAHGSYRRTPVSSRIGERGARRCRVAESGWGPPCSRRNRPAGRASESASAETDLCRQRSWPITRRMAES